MQKIIQKDGNIEMILNQTIEAVNKLTIQVERQQKEIKKTKKHQKIIDNIVYQLNSKLEQSKSLYFQQFQIENNQKESNELVSQLENQLQKINKSSKQQKKVFKEEEKDIINNLQINSQQVNQIDVGDQQELEKNNKIEEIKEVQQEKIDNQEIKQINDFKQEEDKKEEGEDKGEKEEVKEEAKNCSNKLESSTNQVLETQEFKLDQDSNLDDQFWELNNLAKTKLEIAAISVQETIKKIGIVKLKANQFISEKIFEATEHNYQLSELYSTIIKLNEKQNINSIPEQDFCFVFLMYIRDLNYQIGAASSIYIQDNKLISKDNSSFLFKTKPFELYFLNDASKNKTSENIIFGEEMISFGEDIFLLNNCSVKPSYPKHPSRFTDLLQISPGYSDKKLISNEDILIDEYYVYFLTTIK